MADPYWGNVVLLLHADGALTFFDDESLAGNPITATSGSFGLFAGGGKFSDGFGRTGTNAGSAGRIPHSADFIFDGAFTIELWVKLNATTGTRGVFSKFNSVSNQKSWSIYYSGGFGFGWSGDGSTQFNIGGTAKSSGVFYHVCVERNDDGKIRLYVDGVMEASQDDANSALAFFNNTGVETHVGIVDVINPNAQQNDVFDEVRVTKGIARYNDDAGFTPPSAPFDAEGTPPVRVTQAGFVAGLTTSDPAPVRVTQAGLIAGVQPATPAVRVTQAGFLVGVKNDTPGCFTRECDLWKITRTDGTAYRFTSHNRPFTFQGEVYTPCNGITATALQLSANVGETDNIDLSGLIYDGAVSAIDLWTGRFNDAEVEVWRVAWDGTGYNELIMSGRCGDLQIADLTYKFEVVSPGDRLTQRSVVETVTPTCRYVLGESRCGVNLASFTQTGTVTGVTTPNVRISAKRRIFTDTSRAEAAEYWQLGKLTWTSGKNNGLSVDVRSFSGGQFVLERALPYDIEIGDQYSVITGCDKSAATCHSKFTNKINFGGFEWLRGTDDLNRTPGEEVG